MYSFLLNDEYCPKCKRLLVGVMSIFVGGIFCGVNEDGRVVEEISEKDPKDDIDIILDTKKPEIKCVWCKADLDFSFNDEGE